MPQRRHAPQASNRAPKARDSAESRAKHRPHSGITWDIMGFRGSSIDYATRRPIRRLAALETVRLNFPWSRTMRHSRTAPERSLSCGPLDRTRAVRIEQRQALDCLLRVETSIEGARTLVKSFQRLASSGVRRALVGGGDSCRRNRLRPIRRRRSIHSKRSSNRRNRRPDRSNTPPSRVPQPARSTSTRWPGSSSAPGPRNHRRRSETASRRSSSPASRGS